MWRLCSQLPDKINRLVQTVLTDDRAKHANVVVSELDEQSYLFSLTSLLFCSANNRDEETVVSLVHMGVLEGKHVFVADEMSWRCLSPPPTQLISYNSE